MAGPALHARHMTARTSPTSSSASSRSAISRMWCSSGSQSARPSPFAWRRVGTAPPPACWRSTRTTTGDGAASVVAPGSPTW
jgi:hypothetical protein